MQEQIKLLIAKYQKENEAILKKRPDLEYNRDFSYEGVSNLANDRAIADLKSLLGNAYILKQKLEIAEKALRDIAKWDDDLINEWGDPGERAQEALNENDKFK